MTPHQRIAEHLGWTLSEVRSFSLHALRALVTDPGLKQDISKAVQTGEILKL